MDDSMCAMSVPSIITFAPTMVPLMMVFASQLSTDETRKKDKEVLLAAHDSAAVFVATDGQSGRDAVLVDAFKMMDQLDSRMAELSEIEKAQVVMYYSEQSN